MNECCKYAHYYLGCKYRFTWPDGRFVESILDAILYGGMLMGEDVSINAVVGDNTFDVDDYKTCGNFQLMLRHSQNITKKELKEYKRLCYHVVDLTDNKKIVRYADTPLSMDFLFRNGIDAFDLIENGFAIEI